MKNRILLLLGALSCLFIGLGMSSANADSQSQGQAITENYANQMMTARPYPIDAMNDSSERAGLTERLLRMNNPNKIGYVNLVTNNGLVLAHFVIKGKVSSTASQLTNTKNVIVRSCGDNGEDRCAIDVDSMGDDGSYGPEEGGKKGIFFFTTTGVLIEWSGKWSYSDAPTSSATPPLVVLPADAKPSTTAGILGTSQAPPERTNQQ
jgi:hypothetical protein